MSARLDDFTAGPRGKSENPFAPNAEIETATTRVDDLVPADFDAEPYVAGKWSKAATLTFIIVTCGLFWLAVGVGLSLLF